MSKDEFKTFYAASKDRCLRATIASGVSPARAEDAVAEAFSRAWARWTTVRTYQSPAAWIVRTAVNADISWWRKRRRETALDEVSDAVAPLRIDSIDLIASVRLLPPRQRDVVILRYLLDLDTSATAVELGIAPGTVRAHLHHALATLRDHLADNETQLEGMPA